tara:strand:+ start:910 stop:3444 length:2535 start_codon:yes stop_codon:yes gene_type:complete
LKYLSPKLRNLLFISILFFNCSSDRFLKDGQTILLENKLIVNGEEKKRDFANQLIFPKKQKQLFISKIKFQLNNWVKESPEDNFDNWINKKPNRKKRLNKLLSSKQVEQLKKYYLKYNAWLSKNGDPPTLVDSTEISKNIQRLEQYYKNLGYFDVKLNNLRRKIKNNYEEIEYFIDLNERYTIDNIVEEIENKDLKKIYFDHLNNSFLKPGNPFITKSLEDERNRLFKLYRNNGVYNFQENSLQFIAKIDSSGIDKKIAIVLKINPIRKRNKDSLYEIPYKKFKINDIDLFIESKGEEDLGYEYQNNFGDFNIFSKTKLKYKKKAITDPIFIKNNDWYSDKDRALTYRYFNSLRNFKYPSIIYEKNSDSTLTSSIYLTPKERFSLGLDMDISHSNIQNIGMGFGLSTGIRNIFKGTEILNFGIKNTLGASRNSADTNDRFFNIFELGGDVKIRFPKIISPFSLEKLIAKDMDPSTQITFGTTLQENIGLDKQYFGTTFEYEWRTSNKRKFIFKLIDLEFVNNKNIENYFNVYRNSYDRLNIIAINNDLSENYFDENNNLKIPLGTNLFIKNVEDGSLSTLSNEEQLTFKSISERRNRLTVNNLILGSSLSFNYNNQESILDQNFFQFRWKFEWVGNVLNKFLDLTSQKNINGNYEINGVTPSQYLKTDIDFIRHLPLGRDRVFAFRFFSGVALPVGNSENIPFSRSYFAGGANDNRAWKAYKLGPGTSDNNNEFNEANLKISMNMEYRFPVIGSLKGALFIDSGNIWNFQDNVTDPKASFDNLSDLSEIAIGSGIGIRYDFDFFVFRFDTGFKTFNPSLEKNKRWLSEFSLKQAVFNIGINYPF